MGVFTANSALSIIHARDKLRSLQILSRHDIGIPATSFVSDRSDVLPAIQRVGGAPVIIKLLEGTQGVGVILAENTTMAQAIVETLRSAQKNALIQKFVGESSGRDVRAFVVGDRVVAAMRRTASGSEFRSNLHRGGTAEPTELHPDYERTALRVVQILGLRVAGVDMLESASGPQVMEVNACPGLEGIESASGADVAGAIVEYIEDHVKFPEMDLRERLTMSAGYGVGELQIAGQSELLGRTIADSGLRQKDIVVLTLSRGGKVIANPRDTRVMEAGDRLLCFGKLEAMRGLMVRPKQRRVRRLSRKDRDLATGPQQPGARRRPRSRRER
jgi:ribosomal protein S6--L-glutamate ligase